MRIRPVKNRVSERYLASIRGEGKVRRLRKNISASEEAKQGDREQGAKICSTFFHSCSGTKHGFKDRPSFKEILQKRINSPDRVIEANTRDSSEAVTSPTTTSVCLEGHARCQHYLFQESVRWGPMVILGRKNRLKDRSRERVRSIFGSCDPDWTPAMNQATPSAHWELLRSLPRV